MSKIALSGSASGSGTFTLAAPNSDSSYTLNLPQVSGGTLVATDSTGILNIGSGQIYKDASGNVGIGTSSPAAKLDIAGSVGNIRFPSGGNQILFTRTGNNYVSGSGGSLIYEAPQHIWGPYGLASEWARFDSSGHLLIGTTSVLGNDDGANLQVFKTGGVGAAAFKNDNAAQQTVSVWNAGTSGTRYLFWFETGSPKTAVGTITSNGSTTAYNTSSDYRLKENIQPMQNALATIAQLKPVTYNWKADGSDGQGFIAHELQAVVPDCVTGEKDEVDEKGNPVYQGIDASFLVATLTKAIQEQQEQINQLKAEINSLKSA